MGILFGRSKPSPEKDDSYFKEEYRAEEKSTDCKNTGSCYFQIHFLETRRYLQQVRDLKHHIHLTEERIRYRDDAGLDTKWQKEELENLRQELKKTVAEVSEEIGKLTDVNHQIIMTRRYIDTMSWEEIADETDFKLRTVQKFHGRALPKMEEILQTDGLITVEAPYEKDYEEL